MTDLSFRTMLIAVGIFITLATVSAILIYYNVTVGAANLANKKANLELEYSNRITTLLEREVLTGTDVRNLIRYYYLDKLVKISINKIEGTDMTTDTKYSNVNNIWTLSTKNISENNMELINPSYKGKIVRNVMNDKIQEIDIELE